MISSPKLAMSSDFLTAYALLPKPQQRKTRALIDKFQQGMDAKGLNYERLQGADRRVRSIRIDQAYRAIVFKPRNGDIHLLLWAAHHDDAYEWAARHHCRINPDTGALQVYRPSASPSEDDDVASVGQTAPPPTAALDALKDRELRRLGAPNAMIADLRRVQGEDDLDQLKDRLPVDVYEALFLFLAGESYDDVIRERETPDHGFDTDDYAAALRRIESQARFVVVDDQVELEAVLNAPLEKWRVFLHPTQRRLVERKWNGPVRVLGGAGTGKTVVALHRARWLARNLPGNRRILFVTFTRNLAADIENNLRSICSPEELARIEVTNLDKWVYAFLARHRYDFRIVFDREPETTWRDALARRDPSLGLSDAFYREELEQVVLPAGITTEDEYLRVPRTGRGTRLHRASRARVWPVFEEYRLNLALQGGKEVDDAYRDAASLLSADARGSRYASVLVDEAQDLGAQAFRLLRALVPEGPDDLFIVGDGHQRIYGRHRVVLGRCGVRIVGRSRKLRLNYRTTEQTRRWAVDLLTEREIDDLDGGLDDNAGFKSLTTGPEPEIVVTASVEEQWRYLVDYLFALVERDESLRNVCVVARTNALRDQARAALDASPIDVAVLGADERDEGDSDAVRVATMHRVKGLEFDRVVMVGVNEGVVPLPDRIADCADVKAKEWAETEERALLYVAATRAKKSLLVLCHGEPSPFLKDLGANPSADS